MSIFVRQGIIKTLIGTLVGGEDGEKADNMAKQTGEVISIKFTLLLKAQDFRMQIILIFLILR